MSFAPILLLALAQADAPQDAPPTGRLPWFEGSFEELLARAEETGKGVFIDFWAPWCEPCHQLDRITFSDEGVVARGVDPDGAQPL